MSFKKLEKQKILLVQVKFYWPNFTNTEPNLVGAIYSIHLVYSRTSLNPTRSNLTGVNINLEKSHTVKCEEYVICVQYQGMSLLIPVLNGNVVSMVWKIDILYEFVSRMIDSQCKVLQGEVWWLYSQEIRFSQRNLLLCSS